jgi:hypothetical protein
MKLISSIRDGLRRIEGALDTTPPRPGYEGRQEAVSSAQVIWRGEELDLNPEVAFNGADDDEADDEGLGEGNGAREFDPVLEVGAEVDESFPGLGGAEGRKIHQSVQLHGMDALGWYVSFHNPGLQWGIYIPVSGIVHLIEHAFGDLAATVGTKAHLAFHSILNHELFHFATDYTIAQAELAHREPWYIPARFAFCAGSPSYCVEEEQLANAYMLKAFRSMKPALRVKSKQSALRAFVKGMPKGYRDALRVRPDHWDRLLANLARRYGSSAHKSAGHPLIWNSDLGYDWPGRFPISPRIDWRYCPIHLVDDGARIGIPRGWLSCFSCLSDIEETDEFRKRLEVLASPIQRAWRRTKAKLSSLITPGVDFKKWDKGGNDCFSVRVNDSFRAHLLHIRESGRWRAFAIGTHKEMGHG